VNEHIRTKTYAGASVTIEIMACADESVHVHASARGCPTEYGRLSPAEARDVAQHLLQAASVAEYNARTKKAEGT
jgi:hypothetical protein